MARRPDLTAGGAARQGAGARVPVWRVRVRGAILPHLMRLPARTLAAVLVLGPLAGCPKKEEPPVAPAPSAAVPQRPVQRPSGMPLKEFLAQEEDRWMNGVSLRLYERWEKDGAQGLSPVELTFLRAERVGLHLNRGGLADYFTSPWSNDEAAVKALLAEVGAPPELARVLDQARPVFGPTVPASAEERAAVLQALAKTGDVFAALDVPLRELLYGYADAVAVWARAHAEQLSPGAGKR
jgi:hypothetical protein